jgi:hypothetical protein
VTTTPTVRADIEEQGRGFPDVGHIVAGDDDLPYLVVEEGHHVTTQTCGRGNLCHGYVLRPRYDWDVVDDDDEVHPCIARIRLEPAVDNDDDDD